jgi:hypothetical protein
MKVMQDRDEKGVLSYLTLMETLSVIRANKSKEFSKLQGISSETKRVESVITKAKKLTRISAFHQILFRDKSVPHPSGLL